MSRTPVFILTGFLGAGKSTLLSRILKQPDFARTAVIINEFGEVSLDHDLVRVGKTQIARSTTGCLCCTLGSDIRSTLHELQILRQQSASAAFDRVIVETTGLADPAPLVNQLMPGGAPASGLRDHLVAREFHLAGIVTLLDIVTGEISIDNHFEAAKQIAFADRIMLSKTDLAHDPATLRDIERLKSTIRSINPAATIVDPRQSGFAEESLFSERTYAPATLGDDVTGWLALEEALRVEGSGTHHADKGKSRRHGERIRTFSITRSEPVDQAALKRFLDILALSAGPRLLRVKGLIKEAAAPEKPMVIHAVQHVVYPPVALEAWPDDEQDTRIVFITDGIDPEPVRQLFKAALDHKPAAKAKPLQALVTALGETFRSSRARFRNAISNQS